MKVLSTLITAAALASHALALIPIEVKGSRFVRPAANTSDPGEEFIMIGVDYQPGGSAAFQLDGTSDVLTNMDDCLRDAYLLQQLGVNTIRVYSVNPWLNHDACMSVFNAVGIYVLLDVNNPYLALSRTDPASTYNSDYLNQVFGIIDAFKGYPNLLGFFSGNEVVNDAGSAKVVPQYIRAVQRDMKQYISLHANRTIPVGYSAADDTTLRQAMWEYLQCGDDISKADFYGLNSYEWCSGTSDWTSSGYGSVNSTFANTSIPVFFSEYGCNKNTPRTFTEVSEGIYTENGLLPVLSGGLVYEFSNEVSNYGLVSLDSNGDATILQDFVNLQKQYNNISIPTVSEDDISTTSNVSCTSKLISAIDSGFQTNFTLPDCPDSSLLKKGSGNTNIGKLITLNQTDTTYKIYNTGKSELSNTTITIVAGSDINSPSGSSTNEEASSSQSSSVSSAAASATSTSTSKKNDAAGLSASGTLAAIFALAISFL